MASLRKPDAASIRRFLDSIDTAVFVFGSWSLSSGATRRFRLVAEAVWQAQRRSLTVCAYFERAQSENPQRKDRLGGHGLLLGASRTLANNCVQSTSLS